MERCRGSSQLTLVFSNSNPQLHHDEGHVTAPKKLRRGRINRPPNKEKGNAFALIMDAREGRNGIDDGARDTGHSALKYQRTSFPFILKCAPSKLLCPVLCPVQNDLCPVCAPCFLGTMGKKKHQGNCFRAATFLLCQPKRQKSGSTTFP